MIDEDKNKEFQEAHQKRVEEHKIKEKARKEAAQNEKNRQTKAAKAKSDERQQKAEERAALYEEGQATGLAAAEEGLMSARTAATRGTSDAVGAMGGDPNARMGAREAAATTIEAQRTSGKDIAKAGALLGEEQVRVAEEDSEVSGDPLAAEAERDAAKYASEIAGTWDKNLKEQFSGTWNDDEQGAYDHHMDQLDSKVKEIWGSSFRGGEGKSLFNKIKALATGSGDGTAYEKEMAKVIMAEYDKALAYKKTGENWYDWW